MPRSIAAVARTGALVLAVLAVATWAPAADAAPHGAGRAELQRALDGVVASGAPGAMALVQDGRHVVRLASGYADLATRRPCAPAIASAWAA